jgi:hypothetical protein
MLGDTVAQKQVPENLYASYLFKEGCQTPQLPAQQNF